MKKYLIINADDFGMCMSAIEAVESLFLNGRLRSATIMMPCEASTAAVGFALAHPEFSIGVHLTMTSEWDTYKWRPLTDGKSLVDESGFMWKTAKQVEKNAKLKELRAEICAQVDRALSLGLKPSHLDNHIGFAGLVVLPFAMIDGKRATLIRFISAAVILALFTLFHEASFSWTQFPNNMELVDKVADGGILGGFAWGAMLILYLAFSDLYYKGKKQFGIALGVFALITAGITAGVFATLPAGTDTWAGALSSFLPINKGSVSPSYVIISAFLSLLTFSIFDLFNGFMPKFDPLRWWGKNPILMYCIEFAVIGGLTVALEDFFKTASVPVSVLIIAAVIVALTSLTYVLDKKNIIVKL